METTERVTAAEQFPIEHLSLHGHDMSYRRAGEGPRALAPPRNRRQLPHVDPRHGVVAERLHGVGSGLPRPREVGQAPRRLLPWQPRQFDARFPAPIGVRSGHGGGPVLRRWGGLAVRVPVSRALRASGPRRRGRAGTRGELDPPPRHPACGRVRATGVFPVFVRSWGDSVSRFLGRLGIRNAGGAEIWRSYRSLTEPENRQAFVRTMRAVIDPGGQSVSAMDRLYLAATHAHAHRLGCQ